MNKTQAIAEFLLRHAPADLAKLYHGSMEVQVNVLPGPELVTGEKTLEDGRKIQWRGWKEGIEHWKAFRIPWSDGNYQDSPLRWDLGKRAEAIGMTGWDFRRRQSLWVGYDFDSVIGHVKGLSDAQLSQVADEVSRVPWVTARRSKSGRGLHLYVHFDTPVPVANRQEHAALARSVLGLLAAQTGLDLQAQVDKLGCNLWVWHRDTKPGGFGVLHTGRPLHVADELPANWQNHLPVVEGRAVRIPLKVWSAEDLENLDEEEDLDDVEKLVDRTRRVPLDQDHRKLLRFLAERKACWWWDADRHMLVCHTVDLARAHKELQLRGLFYTLASGKDLGRDQNCFAFPQRDGAWTVRRHGRGTIEHPAWTRDLAGWTRCVLNAPAELASAAGAHQGLENSRGEFVFDTCGAAWKTLLDLGTRGLPELPVTLVPRSALIARTKDGRFVVRAKREAIDPAPAGWLPTVKGDWWERLVDARREEAEPDPPDDIVRAATVNSQDAGWFIKVRNQWVEQPRANVLSVLLSSGIDRRTLDPVLGQAVLQAWDMVSLPFQSEYPGDRRWNRSAARFLHVPREGPTPSWDLVFEHLGRSLDPYVAAHPWCQQHGVRTGGDYLRMWCASLIQHPDKPLPYLFFWGPENCGKSTLHEALAMVISGVKKADTALTSAGRFNGELAGQVLCVVEEVNLREHKVAVPRIREWTMAKNIGIHIKGCTPYDLPNYTHWIQCANPADHCPILPGDTRVMSIWVQLPEQEVPRDEFHPRLRAEGPALLHRLLRLDIPPANGRTRIPVIETADKAEQQEANRSDLDRFLEECCRHAPGVATKYSEVFERLMAWMPSEHRHYWNQRRLGRELPRKFPKGRYGAGGSIYIGNLTFDMTTPLTPGAPPLALMPDGMLRLHFEDEHATPEV